MDNREWLMDNAEAPIRRRVARELAADMPAAKRLMPELISHPQVQKWLKNLADSGEAGRSAVHGGLDLSLENSLAKIAWLGLDGSIPEVRAPMKRNIENLAVRENTRNWDTFDEMITSNMLLAAGFTDDAIVNFAAAGVKRVCEFAREGRYDIYWPSPAKKPPKCWENVPVIDPKITKTRGFCYPLIYDMAGMRALAGLENEADAIIRYVSTDEFHLKIRDSYGLVYDSTGYHAMGWDPKYPGWFDVSSCGNMPKLLFFAMYMVRYPRPERRNGTRSLSECWKGTETIPGDTSSPVSGWPRKRATPC